MKNKIFISFVTFCLLFILSSVVTPLGDTIISTLIPPFPRDATKFLNGDAQWTVPAGGGSAPTGTVVSTGTPVNGALMIYDGTSGTNAKPAGITTGSSTNLTVPGNLSVGGTIAEQVTLTHAGTVTLSFTPLLTESDLTLTGAVTFATSGLAAGKSYTVFGRNTQATNCTPTFPSWRWMGGVPSTITARKEWVLSLSSRGTVDTNVFAAYAEAQ